METKQFYQVFKNYGKQERSYPDVAIVETVAVSVTKAVQTLQRRRFLRNSKIV